MVARKRLTNRSYSALVLFVEAYRGGRKDAMVDGVKELEAMNSDRAVLETLKGSIRKSNLEVPGKNSEVSGNRTAEGAFKHALDQSFFSLRTKSQCTVYDSRSYLWDT